MINFEDIDRERIMRRAVYLKLSVAGVFSLLSLSLFLADAAELKKSFPLDAGASCITEECHAESAKKKFVHEPAADDQTCTDCHEVEKAGVHSFVLIAEGAELCAECHDSMAEKEFVHSIVEEGECTSCHDPHQSDNPKQLILPATAELCAECHDSMAEKEFVHSIVEEGECMSCHDPHQSDNAGQLIKPPTADLCAECHEEDDFAGEFTHGPVLTGACLSCHDPHSSDSPNQIIRAVPSLCFDCHDKELKDSIGTVLPATQELYDDREAVFHRPFLEGECLSCHDPHRGENYRLLKDSYPRSAYAQYSRDEYGLCFSCHDGLKDVLEKPRTLTETRFRNGNLNLHYRHVNKKKGRTCKSCHEHHGSKTQRLVKKTFKIRKMELPIEFSLTATGGSCSPSCHVSVDYDRYEPVVNTMKTTPRLGKDATPEELETSRKLDEQNWKQGITSIGEEGRKIR